MSKYSEKRVAFFGDSITESRVDGRFGWPGRIGQMLSLKESVNYGIGGASVSTCRGQNRVIHQIEDHVYTYDAIFLHGGVNGAWESAPAGIMTETAPDQTDLEALDQDTFGGALEYLLAKAKELFPASRIGYIINPRLVTPIGRMSDMREYVDLTLAICKKWGIDTINLYDNDELNAALHFETTEFAADGIHPNAAGYDLIAPVIAPFVAAHLD